MSKSSSTCNLTSWISQKSCQWDTSNEYQQQIILSGDKTNIHLDTHYIELFVCVVVLRPSQCIRVMSSAISLPNHTFSWTCTSLLNSTCAHSFTRNPLHRALKSYKNRKWLNRHFQEFSATPFWWNFSFFTEIFFWEIWILGSIFTLNIRTPYTSL